jgi:hypothetical protein
MIKAQGSKKFRPRVLESLEDRAVPSTLGVSAEVASTSPTTVQQKLAQVDAQIDTAYSAFATSIFQAEDALLASGGSNVGSLVTSVGQAITTLQVSLTSAVSGSVSNNVLGVVQQQINGSAPGTLLSSMAQLFNPAAVSTLTPLSYPLLATAVSGTIGASYTAVTVEAYLYATGKPSGNTSTLNLDQYSGQVNALYTSFASTVFQSASGLITSDSLPAQPSATLATLQVIDSQIGGLVGGLGALVANTPVASRASVIEGQFNGPIPGSLMIQMNTLFVAAVEPDGSIAQSMLPELFYAIDAAIAASYTSTVVDGYILATA